VAFDFDGTLTCRDSFRAFLAWRGGPLRYALGMARLSAAAARYALDRDRGQLKTAMIDEFLAGACRADLEGQAREFALSSWRRLLRPDALECWNLWQSRGARLIIVTATPEIIVLPFAHRLGAELLIGSRLAFDENDLARGLDGANCRGAEKVSRIAAAFGASARLQAAYGDSDGDIEMLGLAEERGYRVFVQRP